MNDNEKLIRIKELIGVLNIEFEKGDWEEERFITTWGTKTREGLIKTISRIVYGSGFTDGWI